MNQAAVNIKRHTQALFLFFHHQQSHSTRPNYHHHQQSSTNQENMNSPSLHSVCSDPSLSPSSSWAAAVPASPSPPGSPCFFSITDRFYTKTFLLSAITGYPDHGYLTMVWDAQDQPSDFRPASWVHPHPMTVRNKHSLRIPASLLTPSQHDEHQRNDTDDDDDDDDESLELEAALAAKAWVEAEMVQRIFGVEVELLREEIRVETTFTVRADDQEEEEEEEWQEGEEQEEEPYHVEEEVAGWGKGARKRPREEYEQEEEYQYEQDESEYEQEESEYEGAEEEDEDTDQDEDEDAYGAAMEAQEIAPSPPTKRAKFAHPCVVPSCGKGYANKASLQRHVYNDHAVVSDLVVRRACRLLWGETFKGGRLGEVNRRYGEYQMQI
jgi:hypothetical protein